MRRQWIYYTTANGKSVVEKDIASFKLSLSELAKIEAIKDAILQRQIRLGHVKNLGDGVLEARFRCGNRTFRLAYAETNQGLLLVQLHFFGKTANRQSTDVELAKKRLRDWEQRN